MIDFIHVGDYKTGTSWLQEHFYPKHTKIRYLGGPFEDHKLEHYLHELIDSRDLDFDPQRIREKIRTVLPIQSRVTKSGICREAFSCTNFITGEHARRNAERLFQVFGSVKVIFVIRNQIRMLVSLYSQYLKIGGTLGIEDFIWDPILSRGLINRLQWDKQISMYHDVFGEENVKILLFEEFVKNKKEFLAQLCDHIGVDHSFTTPGNLVVNKGLNVNGARICRVGNRLFRTPYNHGNNSGFSVKVLRSCTSDRVKERILSESEKRIIPSNGNRDKEYRLKYGLNLRGVALLRKLAEKIKYGNSLDLPNELKDELSEKFRQPNEVLLKRYSLPVDKFKYPLPNAPGDQESQ